MDLFRDDTGTGAGSGSELCERTRAGAGAAAGAGMDRVYLSAFLSWEFPGKTRSLFRKQCPLEKKGNIVARYKAEKDLQNKGKRITPLFWILIKKRFVRL